MTDLNQSARPDNAYYLPCDVLGARVNYSLCLHKIATRTEQGRLKLAWADCDAAIGGRSCLALQMKCEEEDAGKALYYTARGEQAPSVSHRPPNSVPLVRHAPSQRVASEPTSTPAPPRPAPEPSFKGLDFAQVVNTMMEDRPLAEPAVEERPLVESMQPGETPLAFARRIKAK